jgi:rod shape-determining protein MreD
MERERIISFLIQLVVFLIMLVLQISFLSNFNLYIRSFNLILVILVFLVLLVDPVRYLGFAVIAGLLFDMHSGLSFGVFMVTFLVTAVAIGILSENMFTNRSLYSLLVLGVIASVVYDLIFLLVVGLIYLVGASEIFVSGQFWQSILFQAINSVILVAVGFWLVNKFSNKFKPTFLRS